MIDCFYTCTVIWVSAGNTTVLWNLSTAPLLPTPERGMPPRQSMQIPPPGPPPLMQGPPGPPAHSRPPPPQPLMSAGPPHRGPPPQPQREMSPPRQHEGMFKLKTSGVPRIAGVPGPDCATPKKFGSRGRFLLNLGNGQVWDPRKGNFL